MKKTKEKICRIKNLRLQGSNVDEGLKCIEGIIREILDENPELTREDIAISTEAEQEEYEDWYHGILYFYYETEETDEEFRDRINNTNRDIRELRRLMELYPEEVEKIKSRT